MRVNDIFAIENGEHIRILLCSEEQCYAVSCQHFRMPFLLSAHELKGMKSISDEEYTIFTIDDDISAAQRCERDRRFALIKPLLDNACIAIPVEILGLQKQEHTFTNRENVCKSPRIDCGREGHPLGTE